MNTQPFFTALSSTLRISFFMLCLGIAAPSLALPLYFAADIDGAQANAGAGTGSPGTGTGTMILDDSTLEFSWEVEWSGLTAPALVAHFHGPATPNQNAGVEVDLGPVGGTTGSSIGSATITAQQAADLVAGLWYVNIHSLTNLGGEVRGQVAQVDAPPIPGPGTALLVLLGLAGLAQRRRTA